MVGVASLFMKELLESQCPMGGAKEVGESITRGSGLWFGITA
jgi:hypothetical protein